jgi:hypothetical protein
MWLIIVFQTVIPLLLIGMIAFMPQPSRLNWIITVIAFGMVLTFMWVAGRWDIISMYFRAVLPLLFVAAVVIGWRRYQPPEPPAGKLKKIFGLVINTGVGILMSGFLWHSFSGYFVPNQVLDLASPLRDGRYVILHGGASPFTNGHYHVRPQNYALDVLGQNFWGGRAEMFGDGHDLESYEIYGAALFSPCDGQVAVAIDRFEDQRPPVTDTENLAGNHVLIECKGVEVLLAHMKSGSVRVAVGDTVTTQTQLGQVGNTGNTSEPHLHMHAERDGEPGVILDGKAVPITINGKFLVRSDILSGRPLSPPEGLSLK